MVDWFEFGRELTRPRVCDMLTASEGSIPHTDKHLWERIALPIGLCRAVVVLCRLDQAVLSLKRLLHECISKKVSMENVYQKES